MKITITYGNTSDKAEIKCIDPGLNRLIEVISGSIYNPKRCNYFNKIKEKQNN
jgi:hypothetical protein